MFGNVINQSVIKFRYSFDSALLFKYVSFSAFSLPLLTQGKFKSAEIIGRCLKSPDNTLLNPALPRLPFLLSFFVQTG